MATNNLGHFDIPDLDKLNAYIKHLSLGMM